MAKCSSLDDCKGKPIKWIWIRAKSPFTKKKYEILIYVCRKHYELEKNAGIIREGK